MCVFRCSDRIRCLGNKVTLTLLQHFRTKYLCLSDWFLALEQKDILVHFLRHLDTIGNCQRPVFLNICIKQPTCESLSSIGRRSCKITMKEKKNTCHTKLCVFRCLISKPQILNLKSRTRKLRHFKGSRFSQCFKPSTSPHNSLPSEVLS